VKKKKFLSLTWKTIVAVATATIAASSVIFIIGQITLNNNYKQEQIKTHQFYRQAFNGLLQHAKNHDANIGWLLPAFVEVGITKAEVLNRIKLLLDNNWFKIELESDIEALYLISITGEVVGSWGSTSSDLQMFSPLLSFVIKNEEPINRIICANDCINYYVTPYLHDGEFAGIFIFGINLAGTVLQMQEITGASIGILMPQDQHGDLDKQSSQHSLPLNVIALTDADKNLPVVEYFLSQYSDLSKLSKNIHSFGNKKYDILAFPFNKSQDSAQLIIIDDITQEVKEITKAKVLYASSGLLSLLLSVAILLLLLIRPKRRLTALVSLLPLIAAKKYSEVSEFLPKSTRRSRFVDEIDLFDQAIHDLYIKLQTLDSEVEQRTKRLSERTEELQKERNFVANILDTTQVIIMTLNHKGQILTINKHGETLLGYFEKELKNQLFTNLIFESEEFIKITTGLAQLEAGEHNFLRHECLVYSVNGTDLYISWFFTLIENAATSPEILVVGLDLSERRKIEHKLSWLAEHDTLTGLFNRRKFEQELERTLNTASRYNQTGAIIFFDLDQFKYVNDSSGHKKGDELLVKVAEKLEAITRQTDIVARFGGDEFVVLAPQLNLPNAKELVQKVCDEMSMVHIILDKEKHRVSVSAGLLMFPIEGYSEQDLMASVDIAMYKAKESGRGRWCLASVDDLSRGDARQRINWKSTIEKGLDENRFKLYFQPIMRIADKSIKHYECLLRLQQEDGKILPPSTLIKVAEQTGLIHQIDKRVLELAIAHQANFIARDIDITLSVNISGAMLSNPNAFDIVMEEISKHRVPISKFIFEITETQAVTNLSTAQSFMNKINKIGGNFALDDFGVGFSSMSHLKHLPVQFLKIDGSFIKQLSESREDHLFVTAINNVGHGLGIETVAEFVENEQVLETLYLMGVDYAQGYGIGKPMPVPEFILGNNVEKIENNQVIELTTRSHKKS
jgi:diguanylate cyclase (GGDEF)-like protein/PAS domain S-box-containing protein